MEPAIEDSQSTTASPVGYEVMNASDGQDGSGKVLSASLYKTFGIKKRKTCDPLCSPGVLELEELNDSIYGSAAKGIKALQARKMQILNLDCRPPGTSMDVKKGQSREDPYFVDHKDSNLSNDDVIIVEDYGDANDVPVAAAPLIIIIDSDEEDGEHQRDSYLLQEIVLEKPAGQPLGNDIMAMDLIESQSLTDKEDFLVAEIDIRNDESEYVRACDESEAMTEQDNSLVGQSKVEKYTSVNFTDSAERVTDCSQDGEIKFEKDKAANVTDGADIKAQNEKEFSLAGDTEFQKDKDANAAVCAESCLDDVVEQIKDKGVYVGVEDDIAVEEGNDQTDIDDNADIWKEMRTALEFSKDVAADQSSYENSEEDCGHLFVLKDDIGDVCRICGFIKRGIEYIFDFQYKVKSSSRTYKNASRINMDRELPRILLDEVQSSEHESNSTELSAHPRHRKQMKPHQVEGFNFLVSNLMTQDPGGCILAHAPGSGKTFMMICFIQIFLAKYPHARVVVVLPKGILPTWKKEFETWKIEDIPLYDFYSVKADNRSQQLDVLNKWVEQKSILFLGYKQFSTIVCDNGTSKVAATCRDILLKVPDILILDEGHTSRNEETDMFDSLAKVNTPRRVVLSGTLYQNHVKEVFNILNLVRPRFLRLDASSVIVKRIMSRVQITSGKQAVSTFYDVVEHTLQKDENLRRRECVIQDLREMTNKVLHYYKGDFLDELPGLLDFTVLLNLSAKQKLEVEKLKKLDYFKRGSVGSLVYVHQQLKYFSEDNPTTGNKFWRDNDDKIDEMLTIMDAKDGVKARFFLNILRLCESTGEKLLVFSQYLLPLKFFERLAVHVKGWSPGKELFMISGESTSEHREWSMERFNSTPDAKVFFGSIKACGEGISLVGASRILIMDVHVNPSVTRQAIGRAFRPGQMKKVHAYRLVAADSPEEEDHLTCFKKELISKMWFEYNEYSGNQDFKIKTVDVKDSGDEFLESPLFQDDIKILYRRDFVM